MGTLNRKIQILFNGDWKHIPVRMIKEGITTISNQPFVNPTLKKKKLGPKCSYHTGSRVKISNYTELKEWIFYTYYPDFNKTPKVLY